jgi:Domain of unknown function (DUF6457)
MDGLAEWISAAGAELGLDDAAGMDRAVVLDAARDVSAATAKPAVLYTMYLFGIAVGRGMTCAEAAGRLRRLADRRGGAALDWRD